MGNIFSCYKYNYRIAPENKYKLSKLLQKIAHKNNKIHDSTNIIKIISNNSFSDFGIIDPGVLPMSRHGSMRHSRSLNFINLI